MYQFLDEWKDLWNLAGFLTLPNDYKTKETIVFDYLIAWFLGEVSTLTFFSSFRLGDLFTSQCLGAHSSSIFRPLHLLVSSLILLIESQRGGRVTAVMLLLNQFTFYCTYVQKTIYCLMLVTLL